MMNILFFLSPKQDLMYVYDDFTLRQTLEKWENNRYACLLYTSPSPRDCS